MSSLRVTISRLENAVARERRLREAAEAELASVLASLDDTTDHLERAA